MKIVLSSIYPYVFSALFLILPFDEYARSLPNILVIVLLVAFPSVIERADFSRIKKTPFFLFCAFALYLVLNTLFTGRSETNFAVVNKVLVSLGIVILYLPVRDIKKVNKAVIFSSLAAIVYSIYSIVLLINEAGIFNIGNPLSSVDSLVIDRQYLGLLCVMSILISHWSMTKSYNVYNKYYLANIIINLIFVFLIVSRYAVVVLVLISLLRQFYGSRKTTRLTIAAIALTAIIFIAFLIKDTAAKRFIYAEDFANNEELVIDNTTFDPRKEIWRCATKIISDKGVLFSGLGYEGTKSALKNCYNSIEDETTRNWFVGRKYNSHNQFLDFFMSSGLIAILIIAALLIYLFFKSRQNFNLIAFLLAIAAFAMIENFFHRQIGAYYFGFFMIVLLIKHNVLQHRASIK